MLGRESAIEGASAERRGGRIVLVDREGSNKVAIVESKISIAFEKLYSRNPM